MKRINSRNALRCALLLVSLAARAEIKVEPWMPIFQGVEFARGEADAAEPLLQKVAAVRIDLRAPGIGLFTSPSTATTAKMETVSETTNEFLAHYHLQVAINANFYLPCCTPGEKDLIGLAVSRGEVVSKAKTSGVGSAVLVVTRDNRAKITKSGAGFSTENIWTAVAGSEVVLVGGAPAAFPDTEFNRMPHPRTAVGVSKDGRYLILLVIDGRQLGYSIGATMADVAEWLRRFGASDGLNLDGGGSTALVRDDGHGAPSVLNRPSGVTLGSSENAGKTGNDIQQRSNGNNFGVFARPLPKAK